MALRWLNSLALSSLVLSGSLSLLSPRTDSEQHGAQAEAAATGSEKPGAEKPREADAAVAMQPCSEQPGA